MTVRSIGDFVEGLRSIPASEFSRSRVLAEFGRTLVDPGSLRRYAFCCSTHYTRNLIYRDELFEVVALGWESGQASMIHNHRDQECWMGVPVGRLEVRNFNLVEYDAEAGTCRLAPSTRYEIDPTHAAAVDPGEPIHSVHNLESFGCRAISLHVYSKPIDACMVYQPEAGRCYEVRLDYTSRLGELCPGNTAAAVLV